MTIDLPEDFAEKAYAVAETIRDAVELVSNYITDVWGKVHAMLSAIQEAEIAIAWARSARPSWYAIYYRTKKKRIRKKYLDRIIREYRRNLEHGILEV